MAFHIATNHMCSNVVDFQNDTIPSNMPWNLIANSCYHFKRGLATLPLTFGSGSVITCNQFVCYYLYKTLRHSS